MIGLSGGIDSALVTTIAVFALGSENVKVILMPSPWSSKGSIDDSINLANRLNIKSINLEQKFTQPPPRYNQASLIQALEELGIGRPSTYVTIISKILESNYVDPEKSNFQPTALARVVCDTLTKHFSKDLVIY